MAHHVLFFDATGSDEENGCNNVTKLYRGCKDIPGQICHFYDGIGNSKEWTSWFNQKLIQITGWGSSRICEQAWQDLVAEYQPGDTVSVVGFSRGSAIARHFINAYLRDPEHCKIFDVPITGAFLFDTVASFGLGVHLRFLNSVGVNLQQMNIGLKMDLPSDVHAVHALAIDEVRGFMEPVHIDTNPNAKEVYFAGDHSDIGGGHKDDADNPISDISLRYMAKQMQDCGVQFSEEFCEQYKMNISGYLPLGQCHMSTGLNLPLTNKTKRSLAVYKEGKIDETATPIVHESVIHRTQEDLCYEPRALQLQEGVMVECHNGETYKMVEGGDHHHWVKELALVPYVPPITPQFENHQDNNDPPGLDEICEAPDASEDISPGWCFII